MHVEKYGKNILVQHENGYYGCLYGTSCLSIYRNHREIIYTDNRNLETAESLYRLLSDIPQIIQKFEKCDSAEASEVL